MEELTQGFQVLLQPEESQRLLYSSLWTAWAQMGCSPCPTHCETWQWNHLPSEQEPEGIFLKSKKLFICLSTYVSLKEQGAIKKLPSTLKHLSTLFGMCRTVSLADLLTPYLSNLSLLSIYTCNLFLLEIIVKLFSLLSNDRLVMMIQIIKYSQYGEKTLQK